MDEDSRRWYQVLARLPRWRVTAIASTTSMHRWHIQSRCAKRRFDCLARFGAQALTDDDHSASFLTLIDDNREHDNNSKRCKMTSHYNICDRAAKYWSSVLGVRATRFVGCEHPTAVWRDAYKDGTSLGTCRLEPSREEPARYKLILPSCPVLLTKGRR